MAWIMIGKPNTQVADHTLVKKFYEMERFGGERKLDEGRCRRLRSLLEEGRFRTCAWAVCKCRQDDKEYRMNGQHTSHVLNEFNGSLPAVFVTVERYEADTKEDMAELFSTFDPRWSTRSTGDTNNAFAKSIPGLENISPVIVNCAAAGMVDQGFGYKSRIPQEVRGHLLSKHSPFVIWLDGMDLSIHSKKHLRRTPVVSAMFATFLKDRDAATDFWSEVSSSSNSQNNSPSRVLERYLLSNHSVNENRQVYAKCIHAWNCFRRGTKEIAVLKWFPSAGRPEAI